MLFDVFQFPPVFWAFSAKVWLWCNNWHLPVIRTFLKFWYLPEQIAERTKYGNYNWFVIFQFRRTPIVNPWKWNVTTLFISTFSYYLFFKNWTTRAMLILTYLSKLFQGRRIGSQVQAKIAWRRKVQTIIVKGSWSKWPLDKRQTQDLVFVEPHFRLEHQAMKLFKFLRLFV